MQKKDYYSALFKQNLSVLRCPKCGACFQMEQHSLICASHHCYDLAGKGYLHCLAGTGTNSQIYSKALFQTREAVFASGFFSPLLEKISDILSLHFPKTFTLGDMGCGEGSALRFLLEQQPWALGIGIDIAKEGLLCATAKPPVPALWLVSDLTHMPLADRSLDVVFNMLSPAHYEEFDRVLASDGLLIKVLPASGYLKEMRQFFYTADTKSHYSNENTVSHFKAHYPACEMLEIAYKFPVDENFLRDLAIMSPLTGHIDAESVDSFAQSNIASITAAFTLMLGRKG